jgi:hypothetical protein
MAVGFPTKVSYANGDVFSASDINDTNGTINLINPSAKGDLFAGSAANTYTKLSVGANNTVLTADSSTATGLKWASAASGATFISRTSFSSSAGVTIDDLFSSTYENYLISMQVYGGTAAPTLRMQARYGTTTYTSANYQYAFNGTVFGSSTFVGVRGNAVSYWDLDQIDSGATYYNSYNFSVYRPNASAWMTMTGALTSQVAGRALTGGAAVNANQSWTGLYLYAGAGNITGQVTVYGLAAA